MADILDSAQSTTDNSSTTPMSDSPTTPPAPTVTTTTVTQMQTPEPTVEPVTSTPPLADISVDSQNPPISVTTTTTTEAPPPTPPMPEKKSAPKGMIVAAIALLLLATLPVAVFFVSQQQELADVRSKASPACEDSGGQCVPNDYRCTPNLPMQGYACFGQGQKCIAETSNCVPPPGSTPVPPNTPLPSYTPGPTNTPAGSPTPLPGTCESPNQCALRTLCEANGEIIPVGGCGTSGNRVCCYFGPVSTSTPRPPTPTSGGIQSTPTPVPGICNVQQGQTCTPGDPNTCGGSACRSQNWACTIDPATGNNVCNQHGGNQCPGGTCSGVSAYRCNSAFGAECHQGLNPNHNLSWSDALSYVNGCGQVDQVCLGGTRNLLGCGDFQIVRNNCPAGNTPPPPQATPTLPPPPTSTPVIGQCNAIHVYNSSGTDITQALINGTANVNSGDTLTLAVAGTNATRGRFRVNGAGETFQETDQQNNRSEYILPFVVPSQQVTNSFTIEAEVLVAGIWR